MVLRSGRGGTIYVYDNAASESRNKRLPGLNAGAFTITVAPEVYGLALRIKLE
jgi:hypothetical protein